MSSTDNGHRPDLLTVRAEAAALFAAAARNEKAGPTAQLHCLTAATTLAPPGPVPATTDSTDPDRLIEQALRILGNLPAHDFAHPDVLAAAQLGHRALRAPR